MPCSVEGCERPSAEDRYCKGHRQRLLRGTPVGGPFVCEEPVSKVCQADDCGRVRAYRHFCDAHHRRSKEGRMDDPIQTRRTYTKNECEISGCSSKIKAIGLCSLHYQRRIEGRPMDSPPRWSVGMGRWPDPKGYMYCVVPSDTPGAKPVKGNGLVSCMLEHRYVMQQHLGRPLRGRSEQVHHKDGNRSNNNVNNLELKVGAHGSGISITDGAIAHIAYLEMYSGLDPADRAFLSRLKAKALNGTIGEISELPTIEIKRIAA